MFLLYSSPNTDEAFFHTLARALPGCAVVSRGRDDGRIELAQYQNGAPVPRYLPAKDYVQALVLWYGHGEDTHQVLGHARLHDYPVAYCENGLGLAGRLQVDPQGVNARSSLVDVPLEDIRRYPFADLTPLRFTQRAIVDPDRDAPLPGDLTPRPARHAFLPLQMEDDAQITEYSPYETMTEVIEAVLAALPAGYPLLVKEHPNAADNPALRDAFPSVRFTRTTPAAELVARASLVVTVNSSVGMLALAHDTPLVTLGASLYSRLGLCYPAQECGGIVKAVQVALKSKPDSDLRRRFLRYLWDRFLVADAPAAIAARILDIARGQAPWLEVLR